MSKKIIKPGDTLTIRVPVDTKQEIIDYLNEDREVKRNKHILNLLFSKIEEELYSSDTLNISLPFNLSENQKVKVKKHILSLLTISTNEHVGETDENKDEFHLLGDLIEDDY